MIFMFKNIILKILFLSKNELIRKKIKKLNFDSENYIYKIHD
jgi:hypothetical protein